ncbi:hypothetical protein SLE2022_297200 [Rubroshorea leprosula]
MALEAVVFQKDPFNYDFNILEASSTGPPCDCDHLAFEEEKAYHETPQRSTGEFGFSANCNFFSPSSPMEAPVAMTVATPCRRKRRRTICVKKKEELEVQRMTHITVERNRRKQMNHYLAVLRSMMPASYVQRGDQASIMGGAINFVKDLEQLLQSLEAQKRIQQRLCFPPIFSDFFSYPQYSIQQDSLDTSDPTTEQKRSTTANVEVTMVESHANIKVLCKKHPKQLLKMVGGLHSLNLCVLHLNVTTAEDMVIHSFSIKIEDNCQLSSVNEIAAAVYEMVTEIQEES